MLSLFSVYTGNMTKTYAVNVPASIAWDLAMDFPQVFALTDIGSGELTLLDAGDADQLWNPVSFIDDEDGFGLRVGREFFAFREI